MTVSEKKDIRSVLNSVRQNSGDITIAGRVHVWSYTCFGSEFEKKVQKVKSRFRRSQCFANALLIYDEWPGAKIVVGEVLDKGAGVEHFWIRIEGRDVDPASELLYGESPAEDTYFEVFCGTLKELLPALTTKDPKYRDNWFRATWKYKVTPGKFANESHPMLEEEKPEIVTLEKWETREKLQALLLQWSRLEPSKCQQNSPEDPSCFWLVDVGEKVNVPDVSLDSGRNTRLITQIIVQAAVQKALDSRKITQWGLSRFIHGASYYIAISRGDAELEGTGATAVIALLEMYLKVLANSPPG